MLKYRSWGQQINENVEYNPGVNHCPYCDESFLFCDDGSYRIIGFVINPPGVDSYGERARLLPPVKGTYAFIYECQKCFEKSWHHASEDLIISTMENAEHYPLGIKIEDILNTNYPAES